MTASSVTTAVDPIEAEEDPRAGLLVFSDDWGRHPSSCQHLTRHLLVRREVCWVNTIGTRAPRFDYATLKRAAGKLRDWVPGTRSEADARAGPRVVSPRMWPWFRSPFDRRLNRALLSRALAPVVAALPGPPVALTTVPIAADLVGRLPVGRWVYYCVDDFCEWPGLDQSAMQGMERDLVRSADVIITASETLRTKIAAMGRDAHVLTHGVELEPWTARGGFTPFPGLEGLPRPLIVFWGLIDTRMDVTLVARLSEEPSHGTIVLVGPQAEPAPSLGMLPRVTCLPAVTYESLPHLGHAADVLIMPYADLPVTRALQPLKLKEYLATGKPVVARDLPSTREWADCLDLADSPESFASAVSRRLETGLPPEQAAARGRLAGESWAAKTTDFERMVFGPERSGKSAG